MKYPDSHRPKTLIITDTKTAEVLTNPQNQRWLTPFMQQAQSIGQAAQMLGVLPNTMLYRVKQFERLGLLEVVREEARVGRSVKFYRAVAEAFYIPFTLTKAETVAALLSPLADFWMQHYLNNATKATADLSPSVGLRIQSENGELYAKVALEPDQMLELSDPRIPPIFSLWTAQLYLNPSDARELQRRLLELYLEFNQKQGNQPFMLGLALAPWVSQEKPPF